jgi:hypothetical protein
VERSPDFNEVIWYGHEIECVMLSDETYHLVAFYLDDDHEACDKSTATHAVVDVEGELFNVPLHQFLRPH